jgi:peptidoglycan/LPS O-acetylase OafA/YrhL
MKTGISNIKNLHIVRGIAALLVVFFHAKYIFWVGGAKYNEVIGLHSVYDYFIFSFDMLSSCGKECVIIFFILSAFVIRHTNNELKNKLGSFYKIRFLRIYLPFFFSLIFSIFILFICVKFINPSISTNLRGYNSRLVEAVNDFSFGQLFKTIFFIDAGEFSGANYAYWSLGHELIFYILFPFYLFLKRWMIALLAVIYILVFLLTGNHIFYYQLFFLGGLLLYDYFRYYSNNPIIKQKLLYGVILFCFFIAVNLTNKMISEKFSDMVTLVFSFFIFDYILYFVNKKNNALMKLGDISYTLYLNHLPLLLLGYSLITVTTGELLFFNRLPYYSGVLFALLLSIPLYILVEKPSIIYLKKLRSQSKPL